MKPLHALGAFAIRFLEDTGTTARLLRIPAGKPVPTHTHRGLELTLVLSGNGDVIEPENDLMAIGSGRAYARSAARALMENTELDARTIVERSLQIAADVCIYTNQNLLIESLESNPSRTGETDQ